MTALFYKLWEPIRDDMRKKVFSCLIMSFVFVVGLWNIQRVTAVNNGDSCGTNGEWAGCGSCNCGQGENGSSECSARCDSGKWNCIWAPDQCDVRPTSAPPSISCSSAPVPLLDLNDGKGFKWRGTSLTVNNGTKICYKSDPSGVQNTTRLMRDPDHGAGATNVNGTQCFTVKVGDGWTTGWIEGFRNSCGGSTNGTCEQLPLGNNCTNETDIVALNVTSTPTPSPTPANSPTPTPTLTPTPVPCPDWAKGNVNCDTITATSGKINIYDLTEMLSKWSTLSVPTPTMVPGHQSADINGDGKVDIYDLLTLLSNWTGG
jgi:hypothetical protein